MRKYLHWGERKRNDVPAKAPISPMSSFDIPLYPSESDAAREAREQSRRVMEKRQKGR
jgi:hypothetical protein